MSETAPTSDTSSPRLEYAARPPIHRRRTFRRAVVFLIVAALILPIAWAARRGRERATLLYWQRRCASFTMPPGTVAYDENPATVATLWASVGSSGDYSQIIDSKLGKPTVVLMRPRGQWETSIRQRGGFNQFGAVFLHARRAPGGTTAERIVCVHLCPPVTYRGSLPAAWGATAPDFTIEVHDYATAFGDSACLYQKDLNVANLAAEPFGTVRILAGQIDPADASHFTIDFQTAGGAGTIDGHLRADDSLSLTLRQPASKAASKPAAPATSAARAAL